MTWHWDKRRCRKERQELTTVWLRQISIKLGVGLWAACGSDEAR